MDLKGQSMEFDFHKSGEPASLEYMIQNGEPASLEYMNQISTCNENLQISC